MKLFAFLTVAFAARPESWSPATSRAKVGHCGECDADLGKKACGVSTGMVCERVPDTEKDICVCLQNKRYIFTNEDGDPSNGCETKCPIGADGCGHDSDLHKFEVCAKEPECEGEDCETECLEGDEDCEPECTVGEDCEIECPEGDDDCEKPPPGERDCTKDELTTCEDKLCEDVDSCYAVCYANGDRFKCGCDIEMAIFDKEKCVPFDQGCRSNDDCGDLQECMEHKLPNGQILTKCECQEGLEWNKQTETCSELCGKKDEKPQPTRKEGGEKPEPYMKKPQLCDENATCVVHYGTNETEEIKLDEKCVCNDGFFGDGGLSHCKKVTEDCENACKKKYSEDHICVVGDDEDSFTCVCPEGLFSHPSDPRQCLVIIGCDIDSDCFAPYYVKSDNDTSEAEIKERVSCIAGTCLCKFEFPYVDEAGCCTDENPDDNDEDDDDEEPTDCSQVRCKKCETCIKDLASGDPICVCDKKNGCTGSDGKCWKEENEMCPAGYGSCGTKDADYAVAIGHRCSKEITDIEEGDSIMNFGTICMSSKKPEKPEPELIAGNGCCQCAPGYADLDDDTSNGCESKVDPCEDKNRCDENAECMLYEGDDDDEEETTRPPTTKDTTRPPTTKDTTRPPTTKDTTRPSTTKDTTRPPTTEDTDRIPTTEETTRPPITIETTTKRPPNPEIDLDAIWEKLGYKCACRDGFIGNGLKCKENLKGCARFGERCPENSYCIDTEEKPYFKCVCDKGFSGSPPKEKCTEVTSKPECGDVDLTLFKMFKSSIADTKSTYSADENTITLDYRSPKITGFNTNQKPYTAVIEFVENICGDAFVAGVANGDIAIDILDTAAGADKDGNRLEPLYKNQGVKGFQVVGNSAKGRSYVQFTKVAKTLFQYKGYTMAEASDMKKDKSIFELIQKVVKKGAKYNVQPVNDSFKIRINFGAIEMSEKCLSPAKIRFYIYTGVENKFELLDVNVLDCFYKYTVDYPDTECKEQITVCDDEDVCHLEDTSSDIIFHENYDGSHICTPRE